MIHIDRVAGVATIRNEKLGFVVEAANGSLLLKQVIHHLVPQRELVTAAERELFVLELEDGSVLPGGEWKVESLDSAADQVEELLTADLTASHGDNLLSARVMFLHSFKDGSIRFLIQLAAKWDELGPREVYLRMPFFANLKLAEDQPNHYYFPSKPQTKQDGSSSVNMHVEFTMPLGIFDGSGQHGFSLDFPHLGENWFIWMQNRNMDLRLITSEAELKNHRLLMRPDGVLADVMEIRFTAIDGGWSDFFNKWRSYARQVIQFEQYERPELKWFKDTFVQHFTYIFSKEIYNFETNEIEVDRFLKQGEAFGGYDSVILWHQYPRLGVDSRNQWEFFDDFPGGLPGLASVTKQFQERGVKVFLPFKPWDIGFDESVKQSTESFTALVRDTNVDGVFLDTMDSVPDSFVKSIHAIKPDFVFCSEVRPKKRPQIGVITGSWNQFKNRPAMPEVETFRYVMTEHFSPMIARWHVGIRKDILIQRAMFNGVGILVWQDVFGSWLPYSKPQQETIKKWKAVWQAHKANYQGSQPIPLYPTLVQGLHCNVFPSDDGKSIVFTFYNETDEDVVGDLLSYPGVEFSGVTDVWEGHVVESTRVEGSELIQGTVRSKQLSIVRADLV